MDNWGHKTVPKHLLLFVYNSTNSPVCHPPFLMVPIERSTQHFRLYEKNVFILLCRCISFTSLCCSSVYLLLFFFYDTSEMVPIATPLRRRWKWRCCSHPQHTVLTMPVINAAASACSDLPRSSLVLFPCSSSHRAHSQRSRDLLLMICHLFRTPRDGSSV